MIDWSFLLGYVGSLVSGYVFLPTRFDKCPTLRFYVCWLGTMPSAGKSATNRHTNRYAKSVINNDFGVV